MRMRIDLRHGVRRLPDAVHACDGCAAVQPHEQLHQTETMALMGFPLGMSADHVELACKACGRRSQRDATEADPASGWLDRFGLLVLGTAFAIGGLVIDGPSHWRSVMAKREESAAATTFLRRYDERTRLAGQLFDTCVAPAPDESSLTSEEKELSTPKYRVRAVHAAPSLNPLFSHASLYCVRFRGPHTAGDVVDMRARVNVVAKTQVGDIVALVEDGQVTAWKTPRYFSDGPPPPVTGTVPREQWLTASLDGEAQAQFRHFESTGYVKEGVK